MVGGGGGGVTWHDATSRSEVEGRHVRPVREEVSGGAGRIFRISPGISEGVLYIGIGGARRVQMRCGFRPRDRDRML